jgi:sugar-specific transcriptional regulator TrmB
MQIEERVETLNQLGLTFNQARAYLALLELGSASAREVAKRSKITRQDIYRVIPALQEIGIIEKKVAIPTLYAALPMRQGLSILLERKTIAQEQLHKKTIELMLDLKNNPKKQQPHEDNQFSMISGKKVITQKIKKDIQKAHISLDIVTSKERFSLTLLELEDFYNKVLKKGIEIRIITENQQIANEAQEVIHTLAKKPGFKIRYIDKKPEAIVSIIDKKQAFIILSSTAHLQNASALLSNNECFAALVQSYFEEKWLKAHP